MELSDTQVRYEIVATANPTSVHVNGASTIGTQITTLPYSVAPTVAYSLGMTIYDGDSLTLDMDTGAVTGTVAGQSQVETMTALGTVGTSGTARAIITSGITPTSPVNVDFDVVSGDTPTIWAGKCRAALAADPVISEFYTVGGSTTAVVLTTIEKLPDDSTLNITAVNVTSSGISPGSTSADTTPGIGNSRAYRINGQPWDQTDFEGKPLPAMTAIGSVLIKGESGDSAFNVTATGGAKTSAINPGDGDLSFSPACQHPWSGDTVTFAPISGSVVLTIDIQAI